MTARWSLPGMWRTWNVSAVMPEVARTWSIWGPIHGGNHVGQSAAARHQRRRDVRAWAPGWKGCESSVSAGSAGVVITAKSARDGLRAG